MSDTKVCRKCAYCPFSVTAKEIEEGLKAFEDAGKRTAKGFAGFADEVTKIRKDIEALSRKTGRLSRL